MPPDQPGVSGASLRIGEGTGVLDAPVAPEVTRPAPKSRRAASTPSPSTTATRLSRRQKKAMRRLRARKVPRIVRHVDPWSVLKLSLLFYICLYVVFLVAGLLLWNFADRAGLIDNIESFIEDMGAFESYEFEPGVIFEATALGGAVLTVLATGLTALGAVLFNLISDLVGGLRLTVIEEDTARPVAPESSRKPASRAAS